MRIHLITLILLTLFAGCLQTEKGVYKSVSVDEAYRLIQENKNNPNFVIIDVRTPEEFKSGHIEGAINIDYYSPDFKERISRLDRNKTYLVYCESGVRSSLAMIVFKELGFKKVYNMAGGIKKWKDRNYPIVRS